MIPPPARCRCTCRPGYGEGDQRYPVVYFLHGFSGSGLQWLNVSPFTKNVPERLDALIADGKIPPMLGVFIDGWSSLGGSQWINSEGIGRYRDVVARDVVSWVDRTFKTLAKGASRALVGKSSGGYGALVISRFHPETFDHVGVHSADAGFEYAYLNELPQAAGRAAEGRRRRGLVPRLHRAARPPPRCAATITRSST